MKIVLLLALTFSATQSWAWGRRGHETVASLAAQLLAKEHPQGKFLIHHSYDLGYYANVPDLVWKANPDVRQTETQQHFIDFEIFEKAFKESFDGSAASSASPWIPDRKEFIKKYPQIPTSAGRAFWRAQELNNELANITKKLNDKKLTVNERQRLQAQWLLYAGVMGHYYGDLSMPLHLSEDYDGKKAGQGGLHSWFEDQMVEQLYPDFTAEVFRRARSKWKDFQKANSGKSAFDLAMDLGNESRKQIPELLKLDKKTGRKDPSKASLAYKEMIMDRLTASVLRLALVWSYHLGWDYNGDRFYMWQANPEYIEPVKE